MIKTILVTGGAGFIGSQFIRYLRQTYGPDLVIINVDKLTYAGNLASLSDFKEDKNYHFFHLDICDTASMCEQVMVLHCVHAIVHFAAETHVDNSLKSGKSFMVTNVVGTQSLMAAILEYPVQKFIHVSTDEVYGQLGETGYFYETTPLQPSSPYSASKASSDLVALAYAHSYGLPICVTRCSNNYGAYQFPEKLIPLMIINALHDKPLPVYGNGKNIRDWIHVEDHCRGIDAVLRQGRVGEVYHFGGHAERRNVDVVTQILTYLNKPLSLIAYTQDRLGHDYRYAIECSKAQAELGWTPQYAFETGLAQVIEWYKNNRAWWQPLIAKK